MNRLQKTLPLTLLCAICSGSASAEPAKEAWTKLVGKKSAGKPAFDYVENDKTKKNVLIYGDSISIAYTPTVRNSLKSQANVYRLYCNGGDSGSVIDKMNRMHKIMANPKLDKPWKFKWDVIHFNVGLHDLKYTINGKLDTKKGKQVNSIDTYKKNLHSIVAYFKKLAPSAKLIFATTTPVPEKSKGRVAGDAEKYNKAAMEVLNDYPEITVNDLFSLTKPKQKKWWTKPGNVHFNEKGVKAQGDQVSRVIEEILFKISLK